MQQINQTKPVAHYVDGRSTWRLGISGLFARKTGIVGTALASIVTMGSPWWLDHVLVDKTKQFTFSGHDINVIFFLLGAFFCLCILCALIIIRKYRLRLCYSKYYSHMIAHNLRNRHMKLCDTFTKNKLCDKECQKQMREALVELCNESAAFLAKAKGDETINVAIRLAIQEKDAIVYTTYARSKGFNTGRENNSEGIPANQGIPKFMKEKGANGILVYTDLNGAESMSLYKMTENDRKYPEDIESMIVAPINGWTIAGQETIGLFYITSRRREYFGPPDVDIAACLADLCASTVMSYHAMIYSINQSSFGGDNAQAT